MAHSANSRREIDRSPRERAAQVLSFQFSLRVVLFIVATAPPFLALFIDAHHRASVVYRSYTTDEPFDIDRWIRTENNEKVLTAESAAIWLIALVAVAFAVWVTTTRRRKVGEFRRRRSQLAVGK